MYIFIAHMLSSNLSVVSGGAVEVLRLGLQVIIYMFDLVLEGVLEGLRLQVICLTLSSKKELWKCMVLPEMEVRRRVRLAWLVSVTRSPCGTPSCRWPN